MQTQSNPDISPAQSHDTDHADRIQHADSGGSVARSTAEAARGMTLVEIMIVVTIMASIMGVVGVYVFGALDRANVKEAGMEIQKLNQLVEQHFINESQVPENLQELTEGPAPYTQSIPTDPWGNEYIYNAEGGRNYQIYSAGPDGEPGTEDDIGREEGGGA
jgi:general secretion pathway protein G